MTPTAVTPSQTPHATPRCPPVADCSCPAHGSSSTRNGAPRHGLQPVHGHPKECVAEASQQALAKAQAELANSQGREQVLHTEAGISQLGRESFRSETQELRAHLNSAQMTQMPSAAPEWPATSPNTKGIARLLFTPGEVPGEQLASDQLPSPSLGGSGAMSPPPPPIKELSKQRRKLKKLEMTKNYANCENWVMESMLTMSTWYDSFLDVK
eukprot:3735081-Amphidinium_carterae.1